jgi:hypothetical protein
MFLFHIDNIFYSYYNLHVLANIPAIFWVMFLLQEYNLYSPWRWLQYQLKQAGENIVNKIHHYINVHLLVIYIFGSEQYMEDRTY